MAASHGRIRPVGIIVPLRIVHDEAVTSESLLVEGERRSGAGVVEIVARLLDLGGSGSAQEDPDLSCLFSELLGSVAEGQIPVGAPVPLLPRQLRRGLLLFGVSAGSTCSRQHRADGSEGVPVPPPGTRHVDDKAEADLAAKVVTLQRGEKGVDPSKVLPMPADMEEVHRGGDVRPWVRAAVDCLIDEQAGVDALQDAEVGRDADACADHDHLLVLKDVL
mmetsp:Transcript_7046/g.18077  ORF Transcript_7046/g.18077 Transcript_7046/m.18077 type:complete len:220 (+) Transcript_7046:208-867(+)